MIHTYFPNRVKMVPPEVRVHLVSLDQWDLLVPPEWREDKDLPDPPGFKEQTEMLDPPENPGVLDHRALWDPPDKLEHRDYLYVVSCDHIQVM